MFMSIMDSTIVNVALPSIGQQFGMAGTSVDAIVVSYMVSLALVIPASGWLGDRLGTKRVFMSALALFTIASALCGLANSIGLLVLFRVLQGFAGGALTPVGNTMLIRTFPPEERVQVSRILTIPTVLAPASGPVIGGILVDKLSWHWVFYVNVPIGIAAFLFGLFFLAGHNETTKGNFDIPGFLLAGVGLALAMYALSEGPDLGWATPGIIGSLFVGLILIAVFVYFAWRSSAPMLNLRLLKNNLFRNSNLTIVLTSAAFVGILYAAPLFLQEARGVSAIVSGLTTFPEALGVITGTQIAARIYPFIGPRRVAAGGVIGAAIMMALLTVMGQTTDLWVMRILMFAIGFSMAHIFLPTQAAAYANITPSESGHASALYNTLRQVGSALGVAFVSTVITAVGPTYQTASGSILPDLTSYHAAFVFSALLALVALIFVFSIRDKDAAITMQRKGAKASQENVPGPAFNAEASV
jgi:EmrB/QacA subfamily drug resistance transporter